MFVLYCALTETIGHDTPSHFTIVLGQLNSEYCILREFILVVNNAVPWQPTVATPTATGILHP